MSIQAPPNLSGDNAADLIPARRINDWGGVSPVTPDHVNPEAPWPHLATLARPTARIKFCVNDWRSIPTIFSMERLGSTRRFERTCYDGSIARCPRSDDNWSPGMGEETRCPAPMIAPEFGASRELDAILARGDRAPILRRMKSCASLQPKAGEVEAVAAVADARPPAGQRRYGQLCRQSEYQLHQRVLFRLQVLRVLEGAERTKRRGKPYDLAMDEIIRRAREAWDRGATRSLPARRYSSGLFGRDLSRNSSRY